MAPYRCSASGDGGEKSTKGAPARISHLVQAFEWVRAVDLRAVLLGEVQVRQTSVSLSSMNAASFGHFCRS